LIFFSLQAIFLFGFCFGRTDVCNNVSHVLDVADVKDIPIYAGAHKPIIGEWKVVKND
jgi:inosine-uridine nucleoside N-ribohydrolase